MTSDSQEAGRWICFAPREHARERNFAAVSQDPVQPPEVTSAFELLAESALPARGSREPLWQYVFLGSRGYSLLMRGSPETREGATARVVWGLLLPLRFVTSPRFQLKACTRVFPPAVYSGWPAPVDFANLPAAAAPDAASAALTATLSAAFAGAWMDSGKVRVSIPDASSTGQALLLFCRAIEQLAPADRLAASFSTVPTGKRGIEADPKAGPLPVTSGQGRALLALWDILKTEVEALPGTLPGLPAELDKHVYRSASLQGEAGSWPWLASLLQAPGGFASAFGKLAGELKDLPRPVQEAVLSGGFDAYMAQATAGEVAATLDQLQQAGLLDARTSDAGTGDHSGAEDVIPPLRPIIAATRRGVLGKVQPATLTTLLAGQTARGKRTDGVTRYLLKTLQEDSGTLLDLLTGLRRLTQRLPPDDGEAIAARCQELWVKMRAEVERAHRNIPSSPNTKSPPALPWLPAALGSLALHAAAREPQVPPAALQRFLQGPDADH